MRAMRVGPILAIAITAFCRTLCAQDCPAVTRIPPAGMVSAAAADANCVLSDGTPYLAYRVDLPVHGIFSIQPSGAPADLKLILRNDAGARIASGATLRLPLEAGSYRVLATLPTAGPFSLSTTFAAEPSMLCGGYPAIGPRQAITNTLGNYGCIAPDGTPYDAWSLTTFGPGTLTISAATQDFAPVLTLRGSNGRALASSDTGTLIAPVQGDAQYTIVVASVSKSGDYQLTTSFLNAPDDPCRSTA